MFLHVVSPKCRFNRMCRKKMCPFQHDKKDIIENEVETNKSDKQEKRNADSNTTSIGKQMDYADKADKE